jgi:hypothetical protein
MDLNALDKGGVGKQLTTVMELVNAHNCKWNSKDASLLIIFDSNEEYLEFAKELQQRLNVIIVRDLIYHSQKG